MAFLKFLFGKKDKKTDEKKNEIAAEVIESKEAEETPVIETPAEAPVEAPVEKKTKKTTTPAKKKAAAKPEPTAEEPIAPAAEEEADKAEEIVADQTDEEIDAAFAVQETAEVSAEVAQAEAKSGRALARFDIKKSKDNRFVFNLYAPNRVIVATSQIYSSSTSAVNGIKSIMVNAPKAPVEDTTLKTYTTLGFPKWEIYADKGGQFRFRLYAPNGSCIVHSQGYTTKASCKNGIASIIKNAPDAIIDKSYLKKDKE